MNDIPRYTASMPLQTQFVTNADGCGDQIFTQVKRNGNVCVYSRTDPETNKVVGYEVFLVKTVKAGTMFAKGAKAIENDYESYPGKSSFGKSAWSCVNMERAEIRFNEMLVSQTTSPDETVEETAEIPSGEFTQVQFATFNCMPPKGIVYNILQALLNEGKIKIVRKVQNGPGRPSNVYVKA